MEEILKFETTGHVLVIRIDSPATLNAIDFDAMEEMLRRLREFERDDSLGAAVISGTGRAFCTGSDLKCFADLSQEEIIRYCADYGEELFNYIACMKKPIIAAVNGYALGGGFELALACDLRIGTPKCSFGTPEYNFGWIPGWGGVKRLAALIGPARAKEYIFLKKRIRAEEALRLGVISEIVGEEQLLARALEMGEIMSSLNPLTVAATKAIIHDFDISRSDTLLQAYVVSVTSKMPYARRELDKFFEKR